MLILIVGYTLFSYQYVYCHIRQSHVFNYCYNAVSQIKILSLVFSTEIKSKLCLVEVKEDVAYWSITGYQRVKYTTKSQEEQELTKLEEISAIRKQKLFAEGYAV